MNTFPSDIKIVGGHVMTSHTPGTLQFLGAFDLPASLRAGGYTSAV